jgi:two-component system sensor histidine kinase and response regulator WspE
MPDEREKVGKPRQATIRLEARHRSGMLNILVVDDGRGVDLAKLRDKIVDRKMVARELADNLTENELLDFLFLPGFSTRDAVTSVSGRGVGLDVVHSMVHEVRGIVRASTTAGQGASFEMQLPITLSVLRALMVEINNEAYAFPLVSIDHILSLPKEEVKEVEGRPYITFNEERIGLVFARQVLEQEGAGENTNDHLLVIIISDRHNFYGLIIDRFLGVCDLVVQPLDRRLGKLQDISAAAILEDGTPVLIVDVEDIVRSIDNLISGNRLKRLEYTDEDEIARRLKRILVVDDSITVREVERKMLSAKGYDVAVAVDGMDAWNALRGNHFDLVVTDIDMPRMDGIELVSQLKKDQKLQTVPIIIVSYKDRPEDRERGLHAGADYYLTKGSFQDQTLVQAVEDLIGSPDETE